MGALNAEIWIKLFISLVLAWRCGDDSVHIRFAKPGTLRSLGLVDTGKDAYAVAV